MFMKLPDGIVKKMMYKAMSRSYREDYDRVKKEDKVEEWM